MTASFIPRMPCYLLTIVFLYPTEHETRVINTKSIDVMNIDFIDTRIAISVYVCQKFIFANKDLCSEYANSRIAEMPGVYS